MTGCQPARDLSICASVAQKMEEPSRVCVPNRAKHHAARGRLPCPLADIEDSGGHLVFLARNMTASSRLPAAITTAKNSSVAARLY